MRIDDVDVGMVVLVDNGEHDQLDFKPYKVRVLEVRPKGPIVGKVLNDRGGSASAAIRLRKGELITFSASQATLWEQD
jgi:hypothetical protein